ncbi:unnamed protein product [Caenorhabditis auriculariae]|uniref:NEDD8-activating enzyme E1 regulatory subunit n=1 Tax=Caenorhabditis auriculariae TaxID=2777116 RepID=A0A8S1GXG2_9PELO|nr:unnamed protein product [Caenorhabditis auriculariae]
MSSDANMRYDRQVRLWGEEGQASIEAATVCVLGASALGTETLKSLVLAGVHSFCIVDDAIVEPADVGNNFFLDEDDVGKSRSQATIDKLKEMNPAVSGLFLNVAPAALDDNQLAQLAKCSVMVGTNLPQEFEAFVASYMYSLGVPFISAKAFGLVGEVHVCVREHTIANSHDENPRPDLRLDVPFPQLVDMVEETRLDDLTPAQLHHTPYILLYFKALEQFRKDHRNPDAFPNNYTQRKQIQEIIWAMRRPNESGSLDSENFDEAKTSITRSFLRTTIPQAVKDILADEACGTSSQPFWIICEALRRFSEDNDGLLPLRGTLPDMTSDSQRYTRLAQIFHDRAQTEADEVYRITKQVEKERGIGDVISQEMCYRFCKNADRIRVQRGEPWDFDRHISTLIRRIKEMRDCEDAETQRIDGAVWLLVLHAAFKFQREKGRFPGTNGVPCPIDTFDLQQRVESLIRMSDESVEKILPRIPMDAVKEMCRFGASELHVVASFVGGITAQEVIKLATNQYLPIDNTLLFDGLTQNATTFRL